MVAYFFDSSALVKRYARETGTAWVLSVVGPEAAHALREYDAVQCAAVLVVHTWPEASASRCQA